MALDIVHIGDRVVHHQTEREYQGKKGHTVNRVPEKIVDRQGKGKTYRHCQGHDKSLSPSHGEGDQGDNGNNCKE